MLVLKCKALSATYPSALKTTFSDKIYKTKTSILRRINKDLIAVLPDMDKYPLFYDSCDRLVIWTRFGNLFYNPFIRGLYDYINWQGLIKQKWGINMTKAKIDYVVNEVINILTKVENLDPEYVVNE